MNILIAIFAVCFLLMVGANVLLRHAAWYLSYFGDALKFQHVGKNLEVVNVGSNQGKYGFDYSQLSIKAENWAVGPQTLTFDRNILSQYASHLIPNANVFFVLCPFSSLLEKYTTTDCNDKYHLFLSPNRIPNFNRKTKRKMQLTSKLPLLLLLRNPRLIITVLRMLKKQPFVLANNPMSESQLKTDAKRWIVGWLKQFEMSAIDAPLTDKHAEAIRYNQGVLSEMIEICEKRNVTPHFVILPVTDYLSVYSTQEIQEKLMFDLLAPFRSRVQLLNYFDDPRFKDESLYFNSFFLNARGRKLFTETLLSDIHKPCYPPSPDTSPCYGCTACV